MLSTSKLVDMPQLQTIRTRIITTPPQVSIQVFAVGIEASRKLTFNTLRVHSSVSQFSCQKVCYTHSTLRGDTLGRPISINRRPSPSTSVGARVDDAVWCGPLWSPAVWG